ncbi:SlyX protein [Marinospirillum celere]|uniref:Protein SlyX homolog n=1 Tax=Marinospirillum celere TaxID=1122252 RepID=A0A1I1HBC8_9GAMM|nr:SlyX family protein [Marinospirillum celere]SFC19288.1 SlyX protein [Marinospirillum celere]
MKDHEKRLIALETQAAFQDDLIETLNQQLVLQSRELQQLQQQVQLLNQRLANLRDEQEDKQPGQADEKPPHY